MTAPGQPLTEDQLTQAAARLMQAAASPTLAPRFGFSR